jgi:Guanylate-binding protein, C-terminal domain
VGLNKTSESSKRVRQSIVNFFRDREAVTMVRPCEDEHDLRRVNALPDAKIRPEFLKVTHIIKDKIMNKCTPKQHNGINMTTRMFVAMLDRHITALNSGEVPNIASAWEYVLEAECVDAYNEAVEIYNASLRENFQDQAEAKAPKDLFDSLKRIRDAAMSAFNQAVTVREGSRELYEQHLQQLRNYFNEKEELVLKINEELSETKCRDLASNIFFEIEDKLYKGEYSQGDTERLMDDLKDALQRYQGQASGEKKGTIVLSSILKLNEEIIPRLLEGVRKNINKHDLEKARAGKNWEEKEAYLKQEIELSTRKNENEKRDVRSKESQNVDGVWGFRRKRE